MPVSDQALQNEKNRFIAVKGEATVGQALAALHELGGQPWWHLIVRQQKGSWGAARFVELFEALEEMSPGRMASAFESTLKEWQGLNSVSAIEQDSMDTNAAQALARKDPRQIVLITKNGLPRGILVAEVRRSGVSSLTSAKLDQLGGKNVNLKDYGSILLGSSKK